MAAACSTFQAWLYAASPAEGSCRTAAMAAAAGMLQLLFNHMQDFIRSAVQVCVGNCL
jgi:hypothetical protein